MKSKLTRFKQGIVTVSEGVSPKRGESFWEMRYVDPDSGKEVRRRVTGIDKEEAKGMAEHLTRRAYQGKGYLAGIVKAPTLEEGIQQAVRLSSARPYVKTDMLKRAKPFIAFMAAHFPAARTWGELKPGMVETYIRFCEIECLDAVEVAVLLDWLKLHKPSFWPMACLQALCGLRVSEAAALRVQDVDLEAKTVTITDTGRHKPKTKSSYRTIPACNEVIEALKAAISNQKVRPATGELFVNADGASWKTIPLSATWKRTLEHAANSPKKIERSNGRPLTLRPHGLGMARLNSMPVRKLRAAFATMASEMGAQDRMLKSYLGHTSNDMLGTHYRRIALEELRAVSDLMNGWRSFKTRSEIRKQTGNTSPEMIVSL